MVKTILKKDDDYLSLSTDRITNAAHELAAALANAELSWDMSLIAQITDSVEEILKRRDIPVCYPWEDEACCICYSTPDRCTYCKK